MSVLRVRVGGVEFHGGYSNTVREGFFISPSGFLGWDDGTDMRRTVVPRPQAAGAFDVPGYLEPRIVSISGSCIAESASQLGWFRSKLTGLLAGGDSGQLTVEHAGLTMFANARLASKSKFETLAADPRTGDFQIQFWCADPRKYGELRVFGPDTSVTAFHYGNFPALPVLTVSGSMGSGYTVHGPDGKLYTVTTALASGHPHTIDMRDGFLRVDGAVVVGGVTQADLWTVPPGTTVDMSLTGSGSGTIAASVADTYI